MSTRSIDAVPCTATRSSISPSLATSDPTGSPFTCTSSRIRSPVVAYVRRSEKRVAHALPRQFRREHPPSSALRTANGRRGVWPSPAESRPHVIPRMPCVLVRHPHSRELVAALQGPRTRTTPRAGASLKSRSWASRLPHRRRTAASPTAAAACDPMNTFPFVARTASIVSAIVSSITSSASSSMNQTVRSPGRPPPLPRRAFVPQERHEPPRLVATPALSVAALPTSSARPAPADG